MNKLFKTDFYYMLDELESAEEEMRETYYSGVRVRELDKTSLKAKQYICVLFAYIKRNYQEEQWKPSTLLRELYRIAATGEYSYLQNIQDLSDVDDVLSEIGKNEKYDDVVYAAKLLRYYMLIHGMRQSERAEWKAVTELCELIASLHGKVTKGAQSEVKPHEELTECVYMSKLREHLDHYYVGQDVLKKKIITAITQWKYHGVRTTTLMIGPSGSGKNHLIETLKSFPQLGVPVVTFDASSLTPNGFSGDSTSDIFKKVAQACGVKKTPFRLDTRREENTHCIVYLDEIDKIINFNHDAHGESVNAVVQQQLLSALAGTETVEGVDTSKLLFILGGAFPRIADLQKTRRAMGFCAEPCVNPILQETIREQIKAIGGEQEFIGRINEIIQMDKLTRADLKEILLNEETGVYSQKKDIYARSGVELRMDEGMEEIILNLVEKEDAGARAVTNILNQLADSQYFYDCVMGGYQTMTIHKGMLQGEMPILGNETKRTADKKCS